MRTLRKISTGVETDFDRLPDVQLVRWSNEGRLKHFPTQTLSGGRRAHVWVGDGIICSRRGERDYSFSEVKFKRNIADRCGSVCNSERNYVLRINCKKELIEVSTVPF